MKNSNYISQMYLRKHSRACRKTSDARLCSRCNMWTCSSV